MRQQAHYNEGQFEILKINLKHFKTKHLTYLALQQELKLEHFHSPLTQMKSTTTMRPKSSKHIVIQATYLRKPGFDKPFVNNTTLVEGKQVTKERPLNI